MEDVNLLMRNHYVLRDLRKIPVVHGPGAKPAARQVCLLTFAGPADVLFSFVAEGEADAKGRRPRQFPAGPEGLCDWGSECKIDEFIRKTRT